MAASSTRKKPKTPARAAAPIERRLLPQTRAKARLVKRDDAAPMIQGYAAVFYDGTPETEFELWEGFVERIMPGAFDRALREKHDVRGLFNHDPNQVLGRTKAGTMRLSVDKVGLRYEIDPGDTTAGRDTAAHLDREDVDGSSFSFTPASITTRDDGTLTVREVNDVDLFDVGPVTFPAYEGTTAGTRSIIPEAVRAALVEFRAQQRGDDGETPPPASAPKNAAGIAVGDTVTWWIEDAERMCAEPEMGEVQQLVAAGDAVIAGTGLKLAASEKAPVAVVACDCSSDENGQPEALYLVPVSKLTKVIVQSTGGMEEDYERQRERDQVEARYVEMLTRKRLESKR